jgi:hypothetical protein
LRASRVLAVAGIVGVAAWMLPQTAVSSQTGATGPTEVVCGPRQIDFGDPGDFGQHPSALVVSFPFGAFVTEHVVALPTPLAAGTYDITAITYDGYVGRQTVSQPFEQVIFQALAADGSVVGQTGPTIDVPDLVLEATQKTALGEVTLSQPAVAIRGRHAYLKSDATPNSLDIICVGFAEVTPPTTTTTTTTTTAPPPGPGPQPTTTTSSIPTEVLPEVIVPVNPVNPSIPVTPVPQPQVVNPSYTG